MKIKEALKLGNGKAQLSEYAEGIYAELGVNETLFCGVVPIPFKDIIGEDWLPFYDGIVVIPKNGGEVWKRDSGEKLFILEGKAQKEPFIASEAVDSSGRIHCLTSINTYDDDVRILGRGGILLVHGYDGWTREYPIIDEKEQ
jgi:hypothetical protein